MLSAVFSFGLLLLGAAPPDEGKWRALPYLQGYRPAEDRPLVVERDPAAVSPGLNLVLSGHAAEAALLDREGRNLHRWRYPLRRLWPDLASDPRMAKLEYWRRVWLFPNGDLLAIYEGLGIVKLDARSNVLWSRRGGFHHDLQVLPDGRIWVLDRKGREGILEDFVTVLDPRGRVVRRISLLRAFERSRFAPLLGRMEKAGDVFHTNTLEVLDGRGPIRRSGRAMCCCRCSSSTPSRSSIPAGRRSSGPRPGAGAASTSRRCSMTAASSCSTISEPAEGARG